MWERLKVVKARKKKCAWTSTWGSDAATQAHSRPPRGGKRGEERKEKKKEISACLQSLKKKFSKIDSSFFFLQGCCNAASFEVRQVDYGPRPGRGTVALQLLSALSAACSISHGDPETHVSTPEINLEFFCDNNNYYYNHIFSLKIESFLLPLNFTSIFASL